MKKDSLDKIEQLEKFEEVHKETLINIFPEYADNHRRSGFLGLPINDLLHRFLQQDHPSMMKYKKQDLGIDTPNEFSSIITHQTFCEALGISLHTLKKYLDVLQKKGFLEKKQVLGGICYKINQ